MVAIPPRRTPGDRDASARGWSPNGPGCVNTIKAELALWGIQGFKPGLKKAAEHLEALRTVEGEPLPPNTLAKLHRLLERRRLIGEQIKGIEQNAAQAVERDPTGPNALVLLLAQIKGIGLETAQMLVHEVLSRNLRARRAVARYAGLTGTPDESGSRRRDKGISKAGNPRDRQKIGGQAAMAISVTGSTSASKSCPKAEPSLPLRAAQRTWSRRSAPWRDHR